MLFTIIETAAPTD